MLDQIALTGTVGLYSGKRLAHDTKLMVTRKNLRQFLFARSRVLLFNDLRVVFQNIGQPGRGQSLLPEVVRLESIRIGRITRAVVVALAEGQKPRSLTPEFGAHTHLTVVHREMHRAT